MEISHSSFSHQNFIKASLPTIKFKHLVKEIENYGSWNRELVNKFVKVTAERFLAVDGDLMKFYKSAFESYLMSRHGDTGHCDDNLLIMLVFGTYCFVGRDKSLELLLDMADDWEQLSSFTVLNANIEYVCSSLCGLTLTWNTVRMLLEHYTSLCPGFHIRKHITLRANMRDYGSDDDDDDDRGMDISSSSSNELETPNLMLMVSKIYAFVTGGHNLDANVVVSEDSTGDGTDMDVVTQDCGDLHVVITDAAEVALVRRDTCETPALDAFARYWLTRNREMDLGEGADEEPSETNMMKTTSVRIDDEFTARAHNTVPLGTEAFDRLTYSATISLVTDVDLAKIKPIERCDFDATQQGSRVVTSRPAFGSSSSSSSSNALLSSSPPSESSSSSSLPSCPLWPNQGASVLTATETSKSKLILDNESVATADWTPKSKQTCMFHNCKSACAGRYCAGCHKINEWGLRANYCPAHQDSQHLRKNNQSHVFSISKSHLVDLISRAEGYQNFFGVKSAGEIMDNGNTLRAMGVSPSTFWGQILSKDEAAELYNELNGSFLEDAV